MPVDDAGVVTDLGDQSATADESQVAGTDQSGSGQGDGSASAGDGTAAATTPTPTESLEEKFARLEKRTERMARGYDEQRSFADQVVNHNRALQEEMRALKAQLAAQNAPKRLTPEEWAELYSDPEKGEAYIDQRAEAKARDIAQRLLDERFQTIEQQQAVSRQVVEEGAARKAVAEFAIKANLTEDEFRELHDRNPYLQDLPSSQYQRAATAVIKAEYADRLLKTIPAMSAKQQEDSRNRRIANAGVTAASSVNAGRSELTPSQEFITMLREHAKVSDI